MRCRSLVFAAAISSSALTSTVAAAQESAPATEPADEVAALRAQLEALSARVQALESELATARANQKGEAIVAVPADATAETIESIETPPSVNQQLDTAQPSGPSITFKGAPLIEFDNGWSFKPRGRLQFDTGFVLAPKTSQAPDGFGAEVRRARLGVEGTVPGGFGYKLEVDFAGNEVEVADALMFYADGGLSITAGHQNNFQSLEELSSSLHLSFIERAAFTDAFAFTRRLGISAQYQTGDVILQAGAFNDTISKLPDKTYSFDGRAVWLPKFGDAQLHIGGSVHYTNLDSESALRDRQRPLVHFTSTRFLDTRTIEAASELSYGAEFAYISGPFHATGEAYWQNIHRRDLADPGFFGGYAEAGLFLTKGDTRGYKKGQFDRIRPTAEVGDGGIGAWQIVARYDYLDLNDAGIVGGKQNAYLFSLIWTPTDYTRLLLNYGRLAYDDALFPLADGSTDYSVDTVGVRAQVDF